MLRLVLALLGALPGAAIACTCVNVPSPIEEAHQTRIVVFSGTVTHRSSPVRYGDGRFMEGVKRILGLRYRPRRDVYIYELRVDESFKGMLQGTVKVSSVAEESACGYVFESGKKYLVFASQTEDGLWTGLCRNTELFERFSTEFIANFRRAVRGAI